MGETDTLPDSTQTEEPAEDKMGNTQPQTQEKTKSNTQPNPEERWENVQKSLRESLKRLCIDAAAIEEMREELRSKRKK